MFSPGGPNVNCLSIPIIDDDVSENCAENFALLLDSSGERVTVADSMAIIRIDDDDGKSCSSLNCLIHL